MLTLKNASGLLKKSVFKIIIFSAINLNVSLLLLHYFNYVSILTLLNYSNEKSNILTKIVKTLLFQFTVFIFIFSTQQARNYDISTIIQNMIKLLPML